MRIQLKREGGMAYLPGLQQPMTVDTARMPKETAERLTQLVDATDFFHLPSDLGTPHASAADYYRYSLTVENRGKRHTVRAADPVENLPLATLITFIQTYTQALESSSSDN